jgi:hypothetical protein
MKKLLLIAAAAGFSFHGLAQEKYVVSALSDLKENHLDDAKANIDKAMEGDTKDKPKTLYAKAQIYEALQMSDKYKASNPYREGVKSAIKLVETKPDYEKSGVDQLLLFGAANYYNDGVNAYNNMKYADAADCMSNVIKIHDIDGGKRVESLVGKMRNVDTIYAQACQIYAKSVYFQNKYDEAIPLLVKAKNNPITQNTSVYECLIDAYTKQKNTTQALATIQEARSKFPDDVTIRNYELNYYINSGQQSEMSKKLEEAAAKEPNNPDIMFNLATTYLSMANPGGDKPKPANASELYAKAEDAFSKTLKLAPDNAIYNYNFGTMYYNQATDLNSQMNAITGTSDADQRKYDGLKAQRDDLFNKSLPYFDKANTLFSAKESDLKGDDRKTYKYTLQALMQIYNIQSKLDKAADMKKKYESL